MSTFSFRRLTLAALGLAAPLAASAQTVQLTVQPGDPKLIVSKHIQGRRFLG
jgi:alpha-N-arabinofuranosidase